MMRILVAVLSLNDAKTCPLKDFQWMESKYKTLGERFDQLDLDFENYKGKYEVQVGLIYDLRMKNKELETVTEEIDRL